LQAGDVRILYVEQNVQRNACCLKRWHADREGIPDEDTRAKIPEKNRQTVLHTTLIALMRCNHCYANGGINRCRNARTHCRLFVHEAQTENFKRGVLTGGERCP